MILFTLDKTSVDSAVSYIDHLQERILVGVRLGMRDGVKGLAKAEVEAASSHQGTDPKTAEHDKLANILGRAGRVIETDESVTAVYKPRNLGKQPHYWLEYGVNIPEVEGPLMPMDISGQTLFRHKHKAFSERAQPFFFSTGEEYQGQFFERIQARVQEAMTA
jgi:hypothetical protein